MRSCSCRMLYLLAAALAFGASAVAAAADGAKEDPPAGSPREARPADSWFDLDKLDLNVYGFSYHPDRETVHRLKLDNEVNPGLGLHYELVNSARGITFAQAGAFHDSGRNWAKFAGLGYQFKLGERWRLGAAAAVFNSRTYNNGATFIGVIPLLTYDLGRVKLNAVYFAKYSPYNEVAAFGFYLSIPLGQWAR